MTARTEGGAPLEPRRGGGGAGGWLLGLGVIATLLVILWISRPGVPGGGGESEGLAGGVGGVRAEHLPGEGDEDPLREAGNERRRRPFQRLPSVPQAVGPIPWQARIHTNGALDMDRMRTDPAYLRRVLQHDRLKTMLKSPARDTPECGQVVAFVDRMGLPLAATVDFYNLLWATRQHERQVNEARTPAEREPLDVVRDLELSDFQRRFKHDFDVDVGPMLEELFRLPIEPTVFFGIPGRGFGAGEDLLSD